MFKSKKELRKAVGTLEENLKKRRKTAFDSLIAKYENCGPDDTIIDLDNFTAIKRLEVKDTSGAGTSVVEVSQKLMTHHLNYGPPIPYCISEDDSEKMSMIQKHFELKNSNAENGHKYQRVADRKKWKSLKIQVPKKKKFSKGVANSSHQDVDEKQPSNNESKLHSKSSPRRKVMPKAIERLSRTPSNPNKVTKSVDNIPIALEALSPSNPLCSPALRSKRNPLANERLNKTFDCSHSASSFRRQSCSVPLTQSRDSSLCLRSFAGQKCSLIENVPVDDIRSPKYKRRA